MTVAARDAASLACSTLIQLLYNPEAPSVLNEQPSQIMIRHRPASKHEHNRCCDHPLKQRSLLHHWRAPWLQNRPRLRSRRTPWLQRRWGSAGITSACELGLLILAASNARLNQQWWMDHWLQQHTPIAAPCRGSKVLAQANAAASSAPWAGSRKWYRGALLYVSGVGDENEWWTLRRLG